MCLSVSVVYTNVTAQAPKRDEVAITEAMDGLCDSMTMFAYSKEYPRKFLRATGHAMEQVDARCAALLARTAQPHEI